MSRTGVGNAHQITAPLAALQLHAETAFTIAGLDEGVVHRINARTTEVIRYVIVEAIPPPLLVKLEHPHLQGRIGWTAVFAHRGHSKLVGFSGFQDGAVWRRPRNGKARIGFVGRQGAGKAIDTGIAAFFKHPGVVHGLQEAGSGFSGFDARCKTGFTTGIQRCVEQYLLGAAKIFGRIVEYITRIFLETGRHGTQGHFHKSIQVTRFGTMQPTRL